MKTGRDDRLPMPTAVELQRIAPLPEAAHLSGLSEDTLRRRHPDKIIKLSPRRVGMRVGDALALTAKKSA